MLIEIEDSGKGIPEEIKTQVFDPFFTTKDIGQGTGMGLDITQKIISKHKGKIIQINLLLPQHLFVLTGNRFDHKVIVLPLIQTNG